MAVPKVEDEVKVKDAASLKLCEVRLNQEGVNEFLPIDF